jgi:hypothetical protein
VTGVRVNFGEKSLPKLRSGGHIIPTFWNQLDGFSTMGPFLFYLKNVTSKGFITQFRIGDYLLPNATTIIINTHTNERVSHWVELEAVDRDFVSVIIQPAVPLQFATRYVVGVRNLVDSEGKVIEPSPYFLKLLQPTPDKESADRWTYFNNNVFPFLIRHGTKQMFFFLSLFLSLSLSLSIIRLTLYKKSMYICGFGVNYSHILN